MKQAEKFSGKGVFAGCLLVVAALACLPAAAAEQASGPVALLEALTQQLIGIADRHPEYLDDPAALHRVAYEVVMPHVDFALLVRQVLGKHGRNVSAYQRAAFEEEFRELLLGTYLRSVSNYKDNKIRYLPLREPASNGSATVHAVVEKQRGPPVHVSFRMHRPGDEWLIFDVVVEGISLITTHRSSFSQLIRQHGIDHVLEMLRAKNRDNARAEEAGR